MPSFTETVWQVFNVGMHPLGDALHHLPGNGKPGSKVLNALCGSAGGWPQGIEIAHTVSAQTAIQTRARHIGVEKLARDGQQIIQWQKQHPAQLYRYGFLRRGLGRRQPMGGVRAVLEAGPSSPAVNRVERHPEARRQHRSRFLDGCNLSPDRRGRRRVLGQR